MQQTETYGFKLIEGTDDVDWTVFNDNMEKVEEELESLDDTMTTLMETVDGHKIAVGTYTGNGGTKTVSLGFTPVAVWVHNRRIDSSLGSHSGIAVTGSTAYEQYGSTTMLTIVTDGFQAIHGTNSSLNSSSYSYNYFAVC